MYSKKLDTPLVGKKLPISPKDIPLRVVVVSLFAKNETAAKKAKLAMMKEDYIIEPGKVRGILEYWKRVHNPAMSSIAIDSEVLEILPSGDVSSDIYTKSEQFCK